MHTFQSKVIVLAALAFFACSKPDTKGQGAPTETKNVAAAKPAADATVDVDLTPLPLSIAVPKGGIGSMDMSVGSKKSVTVDIGDGASLNITDAEKQSLSQIKDSYKNDTVMMPFKKFAKEGDDLFVVEVEAIGRTAYIGVALKDVAGKKYICKTTGLDGVATAELASKHLDRCKSIKAK